MSAVFVFLLLGGVAIAFVALPLLRARSGSRDTSYGQSIRALYRQRFSELDREIDDEDLRAEVRDELGQILLDEVQREESAEETGSMGIWTWASAVAVPLIAGLVYLVVADPGALDVRGAEDVMRLDPARDQAEIESWKLRLRDRVDARSEDEKSWYLLGHAHLKLQQYDLAAEAFATTNTLIEDDLSVQVYWLQARYLAARGVLDMQSRVLAERILEASPDMPVVLEILALDALQKGEREAAVRLLHRASTASSDVTQQATLAAALGEVRKQISNPSPGVTVNVAAQGNVAHFASVFVIARPVGGGMPFAVVKRAAVLLPFSVRLDDLVSMSEARPLTSAAAFEVVARVSHTGTAMPAADDWNWVSEAMDANHLQTGEDVVINALLVPPENQSPATPASLN